MTAPIWATVLSLIVACIQPVQTGLQTRLQPIMQAISMAGDCCIPLTLIVLGAYFYSESTPGQEDQNPRNSSNKFNIRQTVQLTRDFIQRRRLARITLPPGERKTIAIALLARMLITPILLLPIVAVACIKKIHTAFTEYLIVLTAPHP